MDVNSERSLLIKELQQVNDISLLKAIKAVLHFGLKTEGKISIEQYNMELDEAEAEIERGEFIAHEEYQNQFVTNVESSESMDIPEWHKSIIDQRMENYKMNPTS